MKHPFFIPGMFLLLCSVSLPSCDFPIRFRKKTGQEDFARFYTRFHQDSLFQMEHITFPLEGIPDNALASGKDLEHFRWEKEDWKMHRPIDFEKGAFKQELRSFGKDLIIERISHQSGDYAMLRRYAKLGDEWHLIYYAGLNPVKEE